MDLFLSCVMHSYSFQVHEMLSKEPFTAYVIFLCLVFHTSAIKATKCRPKVLFHRQYLFIRPPSYQGHEMLPKFFFSAAIISFCLPGILHSTFWSRNTFRTVLSCRFHLFLSCLHQGLQSSCSVLKFLKLQFLIKDWHFSGCTRKLTK